VPIRSLEGVGRGLQAGELQQGTIELSQTRSLTALILSTTGSHEIL
jgi:hypothetical protein